MVANIKGIADDLTRDFLAQLGEHVSIAANIARAALGAFYVITAMPIFGFLFATIRADDLAPNDYPYVFLLILMAVGLTVQGMKHMARVSKNSGAL